MRKILIAVAVLVVLLVGGALLAAANLNTWLNENRDWIGEQAQQVLGRSVGFGEMEVSIFPVLAVQVADVRVGDDPAFSKDDFVTAAAVDVRVKLLPALFGNIEVGRVVLREPTITVIQTKSGLSIDSLGKKAGAKPAAKKKDEGPPAAGGAAQAMAVTVSLIDVNNGRVSLVDRTASPPVTLGLEQLDFSASDVSLETPVEFALEAAALGASSQNLEVSGTIGPLSGAGPEDTRLDLDLSFDPLPLEAALALPAVKSSLPPDLTATGTVKVRQHAEGTLSKLSFDGEIDAGDAAIQSGESFEKAAGVPLRFAWKGTRAGETLDLTNADLRLGSTEIRTTAKVTGVEAPRGEFTVASDAVRMTDFGRAAAEGAPDGVIDSLDVKGDFEVAKAGPRVNAVVLSPSGVMRGARYSDLNLDFSFANGRATIRKLTAGAFEGTAEVSGYYDLGGGTPSFDLDTKVANVSIPALVASQSRSMSGQVEGTLDTNLKARGRGRGWENIRQAMTGNGNLVMENGTLKDVNIADSVLKGVTGVPGLSNLVSPEVRRKYPEVFGVGDTKFEKLDAKLDIHDGAAHVRDLRLAARDYALTGEGQYMLDNRLDMAVVMTLSQPLSEDLVGSVKEARYLRNNDGKLEIPVRLRGSLPGVRPEPDVRAIGGLLQRGLVGGLIEGALGGKKGKDGEAGGTTTADDLIKTGLDSLFGGKKRKKGD